MFLVQRASRHQPQPTYWPSSHPDIRHSNHQPGKGNLRFLQPVKASGSVRWLVILFPPSPLWFFQMPSTVAEALKGGNARTLHGATPLWLHVWDRKSNEPENPASPIQTIRPLLPRPYTPPQKAHNLAFSMLLPRQPSRQQLALTGPSLAAPPLPNTAMWGVLWVVAFMSPF